MASTIILKNGTGSAVPSSLTHGELAINVDNGALFYGTSGSSNAVSSSFLLPHISSSTITASGDISASGNITANKITVASNLSTNNIGLENTDDPHIKLSSNFKTEIGDPEGASNEVILTVDDQNQKITMTHALEAASNISSSNNITGLNLIATGSEGNITASGNISASGDVYAEDVYLAEGGVLSIGTGGTVLDYHSPSGTFRFNQANEHPIGVGGRVKFDGHITASGDISSSGNINASNILADSSLQVAGNRISYANDDLTFPDTGLNVAGGSITASGNISGSSATSLTIGQSATIGGQVIATDVVASRYIIAAAFVSASNLISETDIFAKTNITSSGNISASGIIYSNVLDVNTISSSNIILDGEIIHHNDPDTKIGFSGADTFDITTGNAIQLRVTPAGATFNSGHVTASGNISASGNIIAKEVIINRADGGNPGLQIYHATENLLAQFESGDAQALIEFKDNSTTDSVLMGAIGDDISLRTDAGSFQLQMNNNVITAFTITGSDARATFFGDISGSKDFIISNISSSGNITASGAIFASEYQIQGKILTTFASDTLQHGFDSSLVKYSYGKDSDNEHLFYGNITASGIISASSDIIAQQLFLRDDTTGGIIFDRESDGSSDGFIGLINSGINIYASPGNPSAESHLFVTQSGGEGMTHGRVGIGTMTPAKELEIVGDISASGDITGLNLTATGSTGTVSGISGSFEVLTGTGDTAGLEVEGYISASNSEVLGATGSFDVMTKSCNTYNFYYAVNSSTEMYIPIMGSGQEQTFPAYYHLLIAPYDGMVKRVSIAWQSQNPANFVVRTRVASSPGLDINDDADIVEAVSQSAGVDDTSYILDFSSSFDKGDAVCITVQQNGTSGSTSVAGVFAVEYDLTS